MKMRTNLKSWLVVSVFLLAIACATAAAGTIYVDADAMGAEDGSNWDDAYNYLQDALYDPILQSGGEIRVAQGTYKPDQGGGKTPGDQDATFELINGVTIKGGYAGFGEPDPNARDINVYETVLSGDINVPAHILDNSYHVVTGSGTDPTAVIDSFTITGGNANGSFPNNFGGGILNYSGSPTVSSCTFIGNSALVDGGGMYNEHSSPMVASCTFVGNSVVVNCGGGMSNWDNSSPAVTNCSFVGNYALGGGGMCNFLASSPILTNCTFGGNCAFVAGGGMVNLFDSSPVLTNCTFTNN